MKPLSFLFIRLALGASMFVHGLVRMPKLSDFADGMVDSFAKTMLPEFMIVPLGYAIPLVELVLGFLLLLGLRTTAAASGVGMLMIVLVTGSCFQENWGALPSQFLHLAFAIAVMEFFENSDRWSIDKYLQQKTT